MELSKCLKTLSFCQNIRQAGSLTTQPRYFSKDYYKALSGDCYVKKLNAVPLEIERLFPNNEFEKIYNDIVRAYGLKNPPKIVWAPTGNYGDACMNHENNLVYFDINKFSEKKYKALIEYTDANGNVVKGYQPSNNNILATYKDEADFDKNVKPDCDRLNIKAKLVPLTDADKRNLIIFRFAHELGHAFQNKIVSQTEGLSLHNMLKEIRIKNDKNFISLNKFLATWDKKFAIIYGKEEQKLYSLDSKEGHYARKIYESSINYPYRSKGTSEYYNNFLEIDANNRARVFVNQNYGGFDEMVDIRNIYDYIKSNKI